MGENRKAMINVEACINGDEVEETRASVAAANDGGAATVELCSAMQFDGLTPPRECIEAARSVFEPRGLMIMIRPRAGDFHYSVAEIETMKAEINGAAQSGADGVVFGALEADGRLDLSALGDLVGLSRSLGLATTFHRAFDAARNRLEAVDTLIELGANRVLTSGVDWGKSGSALNGVSVLDEVIQAARGRIEIVIGGGVNPVNAPQVLERLNPWRGNLGVHAYSGVRDKGGTSQYLVGALVDAVARW